MQHMKHSLRHFYNFVFNPMFRLHFLIDAMRSHKGGFLSRVLFRALFRHYHIWISPGATIGRNLKLPHPIGIVIGEGSIIGQNVTIFQNVTIGGRRIGDAGQNKYPRISDNVVIFAGAVLAGEIRVGTGSVIGANSVVLDDVPDGCVAVGSPARVVRKCR